MSTTPNNIVKSLTTQQPIQQPGPPNTQPIQTPPVVEAGPPPAQPTPPEPSREQKLAALCETQFLRVQELPGAMFSHRGYCSKCGWQSMQHSRDDAYKMALQHVMQHWKDVVGMLQ